MHSTVWMKEVRLKRVQTLWFIYLKFCDLIYPFWVGALLLRATPVIYGGSQARGQIGAVATGLHHSHSNARSEPHLRPTPQLMAMLDH